jgi:hypothetical protein
VFDREDCHSQEDKKSRDERHRDWELGNDIMYVDEAINQTEANEKVDFQLEKNQENLHGSVMKP